LLLTTYSHLKIVGEATNAEDILQQLKITRVDILITDIMMPGTTGFQLALFVRKEMPGVKIIALSMNEEGGMIARMMDEAKVDGYLPKASGKQELVRAIEMVHQGDTYYSAAIAEQYNQYKALQNSNELFNLTARELEIIECILQYFTNRQIATKLFISERTVETHRKNIYRKTNTKGEALLVKFVKDHKLLR
jgi:two-component system nitrate/nitrite response regulator NarL